MGTIALHGMIKGITALVGFSLLLPLQATRASAAELKSVAECRALAAWPTGDAGGWTNWSMDAPRAMQVCAAARSDDPNNYFVRTWLNRARYQSEGWNSKTREWDAAAVKSVVDDLTSYSDRSPAAEGFLGEILLDGKSKGLGNTAAEGFARLQSAAGAGKNNANAQTILGNTYASGFESDGFKVTRDDGAAVSWYESAAESGDPGAMYWLGYVLDRDYYYSEDTRFYRKSDSARSLFWHSRARERYASMAKGGDKWAQHHLATLYLNGDGGPLSYAQGLDWAIKAARQELAQAYGLIAYVLCIGLNSESGIPANGAAMVYWSKKELSGTSDSTFEAIRSGNAYLYGEGVPANPQRAIEYYTRSPKSPLAAFLLADLRDDPLGEKLATYQQEVINSDACQDEEGAAYFCTEALLLLAEAILQGEADQFVLDDGADAADTMSREDAAIRRFREVRWLNGFGYNRWRANWGLAQIYERRGDNKGAAESLLAAAIYGRGPEQANERLARAYADITDPLHESVQDRLAELAMEAAPPDAAWPQFWDTREFAVRIGRSYEEVRFDCYVVMQQECDGGTKRLDLEVAARWYRLVAEKNPEAAFRLGRLLDSRPELASNDSETADGYLKKAKQLDRSSGRWSRAADLLRDAKELANIAPERRLSFLSSYLTAAEEHGNTLAFDAVAGRYGDAAMGPAFEHLKSRSAGDASAKAALVASLAFYGGYDAAIVEAAGLTAGSWEDDAVRDWQLTVDRDIRSQLAASIRNPGLQDDKLVSIRRLLELADKAGSRWAKNNLDRVALIEVMQANSDFKLLPDEALETDLSDMSDAGLVMLKQSIDRTMKAGGLPPVLVNKYYALAREHRLRGNFAASADAIEQAASVARQLTDRTRYLTGSLTYHMARSCAFKAASERFFELEGGHPRGRVYLKLAFNELQDARQLIAALPQGLRGCFEGLAAKQFAGLKQLFLQDDRRGDGGFMKGLLDTYEHCGRAEGASLACRNAYLRIPFTPEEIEVRDGVTGLSLSDQLALQARIDKLNQIPELTEAQRAERDELSRRLEVERKAFARLLDEIRLATDRTRKEETVVWAADGRRLEALLRDRDRNRPGRRSAVLQFMLSDEKLHILLSTGDRSVGWSPPHAAPADIRAGAFAFRNALTDRTRSPERDVKVFGETLYKLLDWDRIDVELKAADVNEVLLTLDGDLRDVPVAALWDGKRHLIERPYAISMLTPAGGARLDSRSDERPLSIAALAASRGGSGFARLPNVLLELKAIVGPAGKGILPGETLVDQAFTRRALASILRSGRPIIHLATHYRLGATLAESDLLLGDGSVMSLGDFESDLSSDMRPGPIDLLVLGACETAAAEGENIESLAAMMEENGVRSVLGTLWPVQSATTSLFMIRFYARLADGMPSGDALRETQREFAASAGESAERSALIGAMHAAGLRIEELDGEAELPGTASYPAISHPYYWAPFLRFGAS